MYSAYNNNMVSWSPLQKKQQLAQQYHAQQQQQSAPPSYPPQHQQSQSPALHSPVPHSHAAQQQSHMDLDEWHRINYSHTSSHALALAQVHHAQPAYRVKAEDLPPVYTAGALYNRPLFDLQHQHQQPTQQYNPHVIGSYYQQQQQLHERYIHPSDLSPVDSPLSPLRMEYSHSTNSVQSGCDPRYVSGDISGMGGGDARRVEENGVDGEEDVDAEGEEDYEERREDDDAYEEDESYDDEDDGDGEYTLRRARAGSAGSKRNTRTRERYSPYAYPSPGYSQDNSLGISTRSRRTVSNATDSSSTSSTAAYPPPPLQGRRRSRPSVSLPVPIPVPNLTKKSRGRRVPTVNSVDTRRVTDSDYGTSKGARIHTCKVPGCGKCFARGEHLKRHVRSIHTYEKREFLTSSFQRFY